MLRRSLSLAFAVALAMPALTFAAEPKPVAPCPSGAERCAMPVEPDGGTGATSGHYYYVAAIERGSEAIKVEGKLWIEGDQLGASVGCNSIGARVSFDGRTLTVREAIITTEMACEGRFAEMERALLSALGAGPFTWDGSGFAGKGVRIVASEAGASGAQPPDGAVSDPDAPAGKPIEPGVGVSEPGLDLEACRKFIPEKEWQAIFGPAGGQTGTAPGNVGSGSTGSGAGSTGSGAGSTGSGGREATAPPVVIDPAPASPPSAERPRTPAPASPGPSPSAGSVEPAPTPTEGGPKQNPKSKAEPTSGVAVLVPTITLDQPVAVDLPATTDEGARRLPLEVSDRPVPTPSTESCRELLSRIRVLAAGAPAAPSVDGAAEAASARDMAGGTGSGAVNPLVVTLLILVGGAFVVGWLRAMPGRPPQS